MRVSVVDRRCMIIACFKVATTSPVLAMFDGLMRTPPPPVLSLLAIADVWLGWTLAYYVLCCTIDTQRQPNASLD